MKVYEIAKEFGVKSQVIVDMLKDTTEKKLTATSVLDEELVDFINVEMETIKAEEEAKAKAEAERIAKEEAEKLEKQIEIEYKPDKMVKCHSIFPGTNHFTGKHTGMTYNFFGVGDTRNVEYQDLKAAMLEGAASIFKPDIVIDDEILLNDEHWSEVKAVYEEMYDEKDIKKLLSLPTKNFEKALLELPITARKIIITEIANQIEKGTFEQYNKAKIIDKVCGTRFDLTM